MFYSADTVFLVHLTDFLPDISQGVIRNFKQFRVFSKPFDVSGRNFFAVTDPQLGIIDRIFTVFVIKELHFITAVINTRPIIQHIQQKVKKNLTKKYRISAVLKDFIQLQVLKTRLRYIDYIPDIILEPDYIGVNPNEQGLSIELIKRYADNVLIGVKLDAEKEYLYVSTMHDVQEAKITRRLHSGRIKAFSVDNVGQK